MGIQRDDPHSELVRFWCDTFQQHVGAKYPFQGAKDGATLKRLRGIYADDELRTYMATFFEMDDPFFEQGGFSLGIFSACLPKVLLHLKRQLEPPKAVVKPKSALGNVLRYMQRDGTDG